MKRFLVWTKKVMAYCGSARTALNSFIEYNELDLLERTIDLSDHIEWDEENSGENAEYYALIGGNFLEAIKEATEIAKKNARVNGYEIDRCGNLIFSLYPIILSEVEFDDEEFREKKISIEALKNDIIDFDSMSDMRYFVPLYKLDSDEWKKFTQRFYIYKSDKSTYDIENLLVID